MQFSEKTSIHPVQAKILIELAKKSESNFASLNSNKLSTDWFSYHLRQVIKNNWVEKTKSNLYKLTDLGKKVVIQINTDTHQFEPPQRMSVLVIVEKSNTFVVQHRKFAPFKGFWEFPTKRVSFGQSPVEVVNDILENELGLAGTFIFWGVVHKIELTDIETTLDDKYYLVYKVSVIKGELKNEFAGGSNHWLTEAELNAKELSHFDIDATLRLLRMQNTSFEEVQGKVTGY